MDHRSSHHVAGGKDAMASTGARLASLPPYSPDLSPIENGWSTFQASVHRKAARTRDGLDQALTEAFAMMTPQDARSWFAPCGCVPHRQLRNAIDQLATEGSEEEFGPVYEELCNYGTMYDLVA